MKLVTRYESDDGIVWKTEREARYRDQLLDRAAAILAPLGERTETDSFLSGFGYIQHDFVILDQVRRNYNNLLQESHRDFGVERAGLRLACVDNLGREWGTAYYAKYPMLDGTFEIDRGSF